MLKFYAVLRYLYYRPSRESESRECSLCLTHLLMCILFKSIFLNLHGLFFLSCFCFPFPESLIAGSLAKRPVRFCNNIRAGTDSDDHNDNSPRTQGTVTVGQEADHCGVSDTNSDASAAESMCNGNHGSNRMSLSPVSVESEESGTEDDKIDLPFIDFLGVGAA